MMLLWMILAFGGDNDLAGLDVGGRIVSASCEVDDAGVRRCEVVIEPPPAEEAP